MTIGFVGTGTITAAIVTGLKADGAGDSLQVCLSPRNAAIAADLARRFARVSVAPSNQAVLDECGTVVLAVRPQVATSVLSELRFRPDHHVISVIAALPVARVAEIVAPAVRVTRAVPLPAAATRRSPTVIYPHDAIAVDLFSRVGAAFQVETEVEFDALATATATMATYFAYLARIAEWLTRSGIPEAQARGYLAEVYSGLARTAVENPERSYEELAADHATRGGINEQVRRHLTSCGVFDAIPGALDAAMRRVTSAR
jgi:pyrroline-5-carboxylate reductase